MTPELLGWSAGVLDGEGCVALAQSRGRRGNIGYTLKVSVSQVDARMLVRLRELWGGRINMQGMGHANRRQAWQWAVYGDEARALLRATLPYLVTKREQAEIALEFEGGYQFSGRPLPEEERMRRENIRNRLSVLKRAAGENFGI